MPKQEPFDGAKQQREADDEYEKAVETMNAATARVEAMNAKNAAARLKNLMKTPLNAAERVDLERLETQASRGRFHPHPTEMRLLAQLRIRSKLK